MNLIKQKIDNSKYEDFLRKIYGNKAFLLFTIDKILCLVIIKILLKKLI